MKKFNFWHYFYLIVLQLCLLANAQAQNCREPYFPDFVTQKERDFINLLWMKEIAEPEFCELQKNTTEFEFIREYFRRALLLSRCLPDLINKSNNIYYFQSDLREAIQNSIDYFYNPKNILKIELEDENNKKISKLFLDLNEKSEWKYKYRDFLYYMKITNKKDKKQFQFFIEKPETKIALQNNEFISYINNFTGLEAHIILIKEYLIKTKKLDWFLKSLSQINPKLNELFLKIKPLNENTMNDLKELQLVKKEIIENSDNLAKYLLQNLSLNQREIIGEFKKNNFIKNYTQMKSINEIDFNFTDIEMIRYMYALSQENINLIEKLNKEYPPPKDMKDRQFNIFSPRIIINNAHLPFCNENKQ